MKWIAAKALSAAAVIAASPGLCSAEALVACKASHPGNARPHDWAYRTIDGRKCWYNGPPMRPKEGLFWPAQPSEEQSEPRCSVIDGVASCSRGDPSLDARWRAWQDPAGWTHQE